MSNPTFDPYHVWLGIPPAEQPPSHYRLLALAPFEDHAEVIENAADRQMAHVRKAATGKFAAQSQRLLNEISAARRALLDPQRKQAYDEALRSEQREPSPLVSATTEWTRPAPPARHAEVPLAPPERWKAAPHAHDAPVVVPNDSPRPTPAISVASSGRASDWARSHQQTPLVWMILLALAAALPVAGLVIAVGVTVYRSSPTDEDATAVAAASTEGDPRPDSSASVPSLPQVQPAGG
ncbi:MAG: hypothetical protein KDA41_14420, partial [Planctomycetales bacterium]|nr:hypothetical protein [Planctomycetales bacterium]